MRRKKIKWGQVGLHIFLIIMCLLYILPLLLMIGISLNGETFLKFSIIPKVISFDAYKIILEKPQQIIDAYAVTFFYSTAGVVLSLIVMVMFAYALSRNNFRLKKPLTFLVFFSMLFGGGMIPTYLIINNVLHLGDTIWVYIIPYLVSPWTLIMIRTFFKNLPVELFESARMDGASELRVCFNIAVPMSTPILATQAYGKFLGGWNDWVCSSIYIKENTRLYSLQYLLKRFMDSGEATQLLAQGNSALSEADLIANAEPVRYAMALLGIGPAILIFPFIQKYYDKGLVVGSLKG